MATQSVYAIAECHYCKVRSGPDSGISTTIYPQKNLSLVKRYFHPRTETVLELQTKI